QADFIELRTNRNRYKILPEEQAALSQMRVGIVGLSVGYSIALALTLERSYGEIRLVDFDRLDLSNMNRVPTGLHDLNLNKAAAAARTIAEVDPFLKVECILEGITEDNINDFLLGTSRDRPLHLLIEECDDLYMKVRLRVAARAYGIPV